MKKHKYLPIIAAFAALILLVLIFLVQGNLNHSAKVVLPEESDPVEGNAVGPDEVQETIRRVEIRPDTVQSAIATLARPVNYSRAVTVERFYDGGSGITKADVRCADGWTRIDLNDQNSQTRHVIIGREKSYIWYDDKETCFTADTAISPDEELGIPTYERILFYQPGDIAAADYRMLDSVECIYVETAPDDGGFVERCWVSVQSGLLCAAERTQDGAQIYRMSAMEYETGTADAEAFVLPDGTQVYDPQNTADVTGKD